MSKQTAAAPLLHLTLHEAATEGQRTALRSRNHSRAATMTHKEHDW